MSSRTSIGRLSRLFRAIVIKSQYPPDLSINPEQRWLRQDQLINPVMLYKGGPTYNSKW